MPIPHRIPATLLSRTTIWIYGIFGLWQGVRILTADDVRWVSPGYTVVMSVPGAPDVWGWWVLLAGLLTLVGSGRRWFWVKNAGVLALSLWCGAFGFAVELAVSAMPTAGVTGTPIYIVVAFATAVLLFVDERRLDA